MGYPQADLYDALSVDHWQRIESDVLEALAPWAGTVGTAVDLGGGTGMSTERLARIVDGDILACEPDPSLRCGLMARVVADAELSDRVTILPWDAEAMMTHVHEPVDVVMALNMIEHLGAEERERLFAWATRWVSPDGGLVIGPLTDPDAADGADSPERTESLQDGEQVYADQRVGRRRYVGATAPSRAGNGLVMIWRVYEGDDLVDERREEFVFASSEQEDILVPAARHGWVPRSRTGGIVVLTRSDTMVRSSRDGGVEAAIL